MFARNAWNAAFGSRVAFADLNGCQRDWTGYWREFIGRNGTLSSPAALAGAIPLSKTVGAGLDPCGALRTNIKLPPHGTVEVVFFLGQAASAEDARSLIACYRAANLDTVLSEVSRYWDDALGAIQVKTPDRPMDIMLNGWLLYQTLACRIWARSAFYQASGAYGFRDQLQDGMAIATSQPAIAREHLLRAAGRQFPEGDVQHWWLPQSGQGLRTRISDDRVWLAYATAHYLDGPATAPSWMRWSRFLRRPEARGRASTTLFPAYRFRRCSPLLRTLRSRAGSQPGIRVHGLPLIGTGDWNDGMNRVGEDGTGESVWLGWFLYATLAAFASGRQPATKPPRGLVASSAAALLGRSSVTRGTETGTDVAGTTTVRRSARRRAMYAGSIRSRNLGRDFGGRRRRARGARHGGGRARTDPACSTVWRSCSRRRSTRRG